MGEGVEGLNPFDLAVPRRVKRLVREGGKVAATKKSAAGFSTPAALLFGSLHVTCRRLRSGVYQYFSHVPKQWRGAVLVRGMHTCGLGGVSFVCFAVGRFF